MGNVDKNFGNYSGVVKGTGEGAVRQIGTIIAASKLDEAGLGSLLGK